MSNLKVTLAALGVLLAVTASAAATPRLLQSEWSVLHNPDGPDALNLNQMQEVWRTPASSDRYDMPLSLKQQRSFAGPAQQQGGP
jgi:hypothetical protein